MRDMKTPRKNFSCPTLRQREDDANTFVRWQSIELHRDQPAKETNQIRVQASSDAPVDWGYCREVLLHNPNNVDTTPAVTVLFNHDRNMPIGSIVSCEVNGKTMTAVLEIDPEARAASGMNILKAIRSGAIRGVSIGYQYNMERDAQVVSEDDVTTVTVRNWKLREISITPVQADISAQVQRAKETIKTRSAKSTTHSEEKAMTEAQKRMFRIQMRAAGMTDAEIEAILTRDGVTLDRANEEATSLIEKRALAAKHTNEIEAARAAELARCEEISTLARSFELDPTPYLKMTGEKARAQMLTDLAAKKTAAGANTQTQRLGQGVQLGTEQIEKTREAAQNALLSHEPGMKIGHDKLQGNPFAGRRISEVARRFAMQCGISEAADWSDRQSLSFALASGRAYNEIRARNSNVTTGMFDSYVLANAMDKAVVAGFKSFEQNMTYNLWTRTRPVTDFKQVTGAALDVGNLVKTVQGAPFPELVKAEFGYVAQLAMWGVTASLSGETLINDDLGEFMNQVFRAGAIANRTIEKEVYAQLEAATWTNNTSSGAGLGTGAAPTPGNLDVSRKAFRNKTGPAGEKLGNVPKYLIHTPDIALPVDIALGRVINYAGVQASVRSSSMIPIETPYLTGTATTHYLAGDPNLVDTLILLMLLGMMVPQIEDYDSGAVFGRSWKIYLPFTAKPVITSVNLAAGSTAYIAPGLQQATV